MSEHHSPRSDKVPDPARQKQIWRDYHTYTVGWEMLVRKFPYTERVLKIIIAKQLECTCGKIEP